VPECIFAENRRKPTKINHLQGIFARKDLHINRHGFPESLHINRHGNGGGSRIVAPGSVTRLAVAASSGRIHRRFCPPDVLSAIAAGYKQLTTSQNRSHTHTPDNQFA
jgi:hypothetical protein